MNCQEKTKEELLKTLRITLAEALECNRRDAMIQAGRRIIYDRTDRCMKLRKFLCYLISQECELLGEGGRHSWWISPALNKRSAVLRHTEIGNNPAVKICKDPGIPKVK
ncbi:MAG: hypothetical protein V2I97_22725 [Desulfococcaceae bacterium]|nr:hypothetical protein [Desulfococcaceae bacterium]